MSKTHIPRSFQQPGFVTDTLCGRVERHGTADHDLIIRQALAVVRDSPAEVCAACLRRHMAERSA